MQRGRLWRRAVPLTVLAALLVAALTTGPSPCPAFSWSARSNKMAGAAPALPTEPAPAAQPAAAVQPASLARPVADADRTSAAPPALAALAEPASPPAAAAPPPDATPAGPPQPPLPLVAGARRQVPVLMYHVLGDGDNSLYVSVADFHAQMDWLAQHGYHTVTLLQLYENQTKGEPLPEKPIVLTFDDGYSSFYTVGYPYFKQHGFTAVLFAVPGFFGKPGYVTAEQVVEMDRGGMEIESHTLHHLDLPSLPEQALVHEVVDSKKDLEQRLGHPVLFFCYPSGSYNGRVLAAVKEAGYLAGLTTHYGPVTPDQDPYQWRRVRISRGTSLAGFAAQVREASAD